MKPTIMILAITLLLGLQFKDNNKHSILPENDLYLEDQILADGRGPNGMTEKIFNKIIENLELTFEPTIQKMEPGARLVINKKWSDSTVNSYAHISDNWYIIDTFGGIARRPEITPDGYAMVLCHELGHLMKQQPSFTHASMKGMSVEGQADYFAASDCAYKILGTYREDLEIDYTLPQQVIDACRLTYENEQWYVSCLKTNKASLSVTTLFANLEKTKIPSFLTPDEKVVAELYQYHPKPQCRLDTLFSASIGNPRPLCWFKP